MNRRKWEGQHHTVERWLAKLMEEHGEVGKAVSDMFDIDAQKHAYKSKPGRIARVEKNLIEELEHVEFIARCFREDLERQGMIR